MSSLYERIDFLCKQNNTNITSMCKELGIARSSLSELKAGRTKSLSSYYLQQISDKFAVPMRYLLTGEQDERLPYATSAEKIVVPVLGTVPAGVPVEAVQDILDYEELSAKEFNPNDEYFALKVQGDSMYPKYLEGDIVIFRVQGDFNSMDDCLVYINGYDATLKTVKKNSDGSITLQPINPNYAPQTFTAEQIERYPVSVAGVALQLRRDV